LALVSDYNDGAGRFTHTDGVFDRRGDGGERLRQEVCGSGRGPQPSGRGRQEEIYRGPPPYFHMPWSPLKIKKHPTSFKD
jgi:hypothetical protein